MSFGNTKVIKNSKSIFIIYINKHYIFILKKDLTKEQYIIQNTNLTRVHTVTQSLTFIIISKLIDFQLIRKKLHKRQKKNQKK